MQKPRVVLDRLTERVTADVIGHDRAMVIAARFGELRTTHTPDDIRRSMMKVLDSSAAITMHWIEFDVPAWKLAGPNPPSECGGSSSSTSCS